MKKFFSTSLSLLLAILCLFALVGCGDAAKEESSNSESSVSEIQSEVPASSDATSESTESTNENTVEKTGLWENATYLKDMEFGEGEKTIVVEVKIQDQTVVFTVNTDKTTVGEALLDNGLIDGEQGAYGLYVKKVNGVTADYDIDASYWAFYINGEYALSGVDTTEIDESAVYKLEYTK